jgi:hypothetical protein
MLGISATKPNLSVFALVRTKRDCFYPPINADFTPLKRYLHPYPSSNEAAEAILPKFNLDGRFFTAAFINPYEQVTLR